MGRWQRDGNERRRIVQGSRSNAEKQYLPDGIKAMEGHMTKVTSADEYKLHSSFDEIRNVLLDGRYTDRRHKPLAYWALPNDRRLPLAFLGRTIDDLLSTPFDELSSTAGIGQKKIGSLVRLLHRATQDQPPAVPFGISDRSGEQDSAGPEIDDTQPNNFDPSIVSESLWTQWRDTVRQREVGHEKLGRLAPTLQALPTVIWHSPLQYYLDFSVSEIRQLKTHGEKRVRVVLEVFHVVHELLSNTSARSHLDVRLVPKFIPPMEDWISDVMQRTEGLPPGELQRELILPMLRQIEIDAGPTVHKLANSRLGIDGESQSVRAQSRRMGVTRARVYQLLDDCSKVMNVRWPEGEQRLVRLAEHLKEQQGDASDLETLDAASELLFPKKYAHLMDEGENGAPE